MACRHHSSYNQLCGYLKETYDKEHRARLAFYAKTKKKSDQKPKQSEFRRKIENHIPLEDPLERLPTVVREPKHNRKMHDPVDSKLLKAHTSLSFRLGAENFNEMRPVTAKTKSKLFQGFSREGKGRHQYLNKRYQKIPEDRFQYPILTSWDYGWRLSDWINFREVQKPAYCRTSIIEDTFFSRNGIHTIR